MPMTQLDPVSALVLIDLQQGLKGAPTAVPMSEIIARGAALAAAFRKRGLPVVLVNVDGRAPGRTEAGAPRFALPEGWQELVPELDVQPEDIRITKQRHGAFIGTKLDEELRSRGVTQVVLAGVSTSSGVEATGRSAYDFGYNVVFVTDAMADLDVETHRHCVEKVFPKIGERETTEGVLERLASA